LREFVVFGIKVRHREVEDLSQLLHGLQVGLVDAGFVAVDAGARDEIVETCVDAQVALRDAADLPRLAQPAAVDGELSFLSQAFSSSGLPYAEASGRALDLDTT